MKHDRTLIIWGLTLIFIIIFLLIATREDFVKNKNPIIQTTPDNTMLGIKLALSNNGKAEAESGYIRENGIEFFVVHIKTNEYEVTSSKCFYDKGKNVINFINGLVIQQNNGQKMKAKSAIFDMNDMKLKNIKGQTLYIK